MAINPVESRGVCDFLRSVSRERYRCRVDCRCGTLYQHCRDNRSSTFSRKDPAGANSSFRMSPQGLQSSIRVRIEGKAKCKREAARGNSTAKMRNTLESGRSRAIPIRASSMQRKDIQNFEFGI